MAMIKKLNGKIKTVEQTGAPRTIMMAKSGIYARARLTSPEIVVEIAKMDFGTRTRFMSEAFHPMLPIAVVVVWEKNPKTRYSDKKYVSKCSIPANRKMLEKTMVRMIMRRSGFNIVQKNPITDRL